MLDEEEFDPTVDLASMFVRYSIRMLVHPGRHAQVTESFRVTVNFQGIPYEARACVDAAVCHAVRQYPLIWKTGIVDVNELRRRNVVTYDIRPITTASINARRTMVKQLAHSIKWFQLTPLMALEQ